jgi:phosphoribosyl 1,2-cyclic phosphodiesterase
MIGFCPLASGSRGNALFIGTHSSKILVDAGISAKGIKERLEEIGTRIEDIDAIMISHEHHDHIAALKILAFRYGIPIIANHETAKAICEALRDCPKFKIFTTGEPFEFQDLHITPFSVRHDACDPVGFAVMAEGKKLGIATDLGQVTPQVLFHLAGSEILYVEANHDKELVKSSPRPYVYKERVLSPLGHLSNEEAAKLIEAIFHEGLKDIFLAHLSSECNTPEKAICAVAEVLGDKMEQLSLEIAHQNKISKMVPFLEKIASLS